VRHSVRLVAVKLPHAASYCRHKPQCPLPVSASASASTSASRPRRSEHEAVTARTVCPNRLACTAIRPSAASNVISLSRAELAALLHCSTCICASATHQFVRQFRGHCDLHQFLLASDLLALGLELGRRAALHHIRPRSDLLAWSPNTQALQAHFTSACTPPKTLATFSHPSSHLLTPPASSALTRFLPLSHSPHTSIAICHYRFPTLVPSPQ